MNPYPYGTSCPVSMHLALFAVNLALYGFGVLVSLKLAQDCTVRGQSLPGVTNDCDRALRRRTGLSVRRYPLDRQAIQECGRTLKVGKSLLSCVHPIMMHRTNRPRVSNRRATSGGPPRPCSVSLCRWAVHDGCYGVDPCGSVVVGGPADENPAGRRSGVPRWACAGQRSTGQAVDHGVSR